MTPTGVLFRRTIAHAIRPYLACGLPGGARLLRLSGADSEEVWAGASPAKTRLRWGAGTVYLDRTEKYERLAWFYSRYHELPLLLLMNGLLRAGDVFIDVGANLGLVSLHAARIVGNTGRVVAFEPNPVVRARMESHVHASGRTVSLSGFALGDEPGELVLSVIGKNTGSGTLGVVPDHLRAQIREMYQVSVVVGDSLDAIWSSLPTSSRVLLKVDAEGSEIRVLKGLRGLLERFRPVVVSEINPFALRMNGGGPRLLQHFMRSLGYDGYELEAQRKGLTSIEPVLGRMRPPRRAGLRDVVWIHTDGPWRNELQRMITHAARVVVNQRALGPTSSTPAPSPAPSAPVR